MRSNVQEGLGGNVYYNGLPKGCQLCYRGKKLVVFLTGLCPLNCFYCPIGSERKGVDRTYANERPVKDIIEICEEGELMDAEGAGITGGEPLVKPLKVIQVIRCLKDHFGERFHIHLYTSGITLSRRVLEKIVKAGLDELRIHTFDVKFLNEKKPILEEFKDTIDIGLELPVIPGWENKIVSIIESASDVISFVNLNELEFSETNSLALLSRGFTLKRGSMAAANGSYETGLYVIDQLIEKFNLKIHLCTVVYKNRFQTTLRYFRRGQNTALNHEIVNDEGLLIKIITEDGKEYHIFDAFPKNKHMKIIEEIPTFKRIRVSEISLD